MWLVVRRYIDILTIIINFPYSLVLALFWQQHPYFFVHLKNFFWSLRIRIRSRNGDFLLRLRYYGDVIRSFYCKSAVEHDGGF